MSFQSFSRSKLCTFCEAEIRVNGMESRIQGCSNKLDRHITLLQTRLQEEISSKDESSKELQEGVAEKGQAHAEEVERNVQKLRSDKHTAERNVVVARDGL